jgi:hypothetical protein
MTEAAQIYNGHRADPLLPNHPSDAAPSSLPASNGAPSAQDIDMKEEVCHKTSPQQHQFPSRVWLLSVPEARAHHLH